VVHLCLNSRYAQKAKMYDKFLRIGGRRALPLPFPTIVQCDGSYGRQQVAAVAYLVYDSSRQVMMSKRVDLPFATSSTEAEWAAVAQGLEAALELEKETIGLENDCLSVIAGLAHPSNPLRHVYARHYRKKILDLAAQTLWTGVRWIPRKANRADDLFRRLA
jgi:ribonuclease HI